MDPGTFAAVAQGAGSLLSGLGIGKSSSKGPSPQEQAAATLGYERDSLNQKLALAKDHGIHPLSMLGVPMGSFTPTWYVGGDRGADPAGIGQGAAQIARSFVKPPEESQTDPLAQRAAEANVRLLEAQAKRAEWDALGTEWKVADYAAPRLLQGQPGNPPGARLSNDAVEMQRLAAEQAGLNPRLLGAPALGLKQDVLPPHPVKLGHGALTDQSMITVMGPDGKPASLLNQNAVQAEFNDGATMTWLVKTFGVERATEIMAALEQKGIFGALGLAAAGAGKMAYDYFARQGREADARRGVGMKFKSRNQRKYSIRKGGDQ